MMAMSNLEDILITLGHEVIEILLKMWLFFKIVSTISEVRKVFMFPMRYGKTLTEVIKGLLHSLHQSNSNS